MDRISNNRTFQPKTCSFGFRILSFYSHSQSFTFYLVYFTIKYRNISNTFLVQIYANNRFIFTNYRKTSSTYPMSADLVRQPTLTAVVAQFIDPSRISAVSKRCSTWRVWSNDKRILPSTVPQNQWPELTHNRLSMFHRHARKGSYPIWTDAADRFIVKLSFVVLNNIIDYLLWKTWIA